MAFEAVAVATAMPVTVRDLDGLPAYAWAFTGFLATFLYATVVSGELCDRVGPRRPVLIGLVCFLGGLLVAGCAPTMPVFVLGRALQGLGVGFLIVAVYVIVARAYPEDVRPQVFSAMAAAWILPALIGPVIAGFFADQLTWRLVFLTVPLLVVPAAWAIWPTLRAVDGPPPEPTTRTGRKRAALATAVGVAALQQAGIVGGLWSVPLGVLAVVLLVRSVPQLLPRGTVRLARGLPTTIAMRGLLAGPFAVVDSFIPLMLVSHRGLSTTAAGFALVGGTFGWAAGSWAQARAEGGAAGRIRLVRIGSVLLSVGTVGVIVAIGAPASGWVVAGSWAVAGAGMGLAFASINVVALHLSPVADQGATSAAIQVSDGLAGVLLTAIAGAIYATFGASSASSGAVFVAIFAVPLAVALFAVLVSGRMNPGAAAGASPAAASAAASGGSGSRPSPA